MRANDVNDTMNGGAYSSRFAMGLLCGAAVGAALGLLLAPKPGAALRRDLMKSANDLGGRAKKLYDGAAERLGDLADQGASLASQVGDASKVAANRARQQAGGGGV